MDNNNNFIATGRRKKSVARVRVLPGTGKVIVNERLCDDYFNGLGRHKRESILPLSIFPSSKQYDFYLNVFGGGITGQAGAIKHALARVILSMDPNMKMSLRKEGMLTRDPRMVERKKSGMPKARKRFQFSKR